MDYSLTLVGGLEAGEDEVLSRSLFGERGPTRAEDAQGTPTQSQLSPITLVYEDESHSGLRRSVHVFSSY